MRAFGEGFVSYRPPVDLKTTAGIHGVKSNGNTEILLNFITPHQKWGIHSTYTDNLMMLTLSRTRSAANSGNRSMLFSPKRYSTSMFCPST